MTKKNALVCLSRLFFLISLLQTNSGLERKCEENIYMLADELIIY